MPIVAILAFVTLGLPQATPSAEPQSAERAPFSDPYVNRLFQLCCTWKKVNSDDRTAACHLLSSAARHEHRWRIILEELRQGRAEERTCLQVLGKIAAVDARARAILAMPPEERNKVAWMADIALDDAVVPELLTRAEAADRHIVDHYVIALARARDPRTIEFLRHVLSDDQGKNHLIASRFHAAVGLANLSDPAAIEWLIANGDARQGMITNAWPAKVCDTELSTSCVQALRYLTHQFGLASKSDWQKWWLDNHASFRPPGVIELYESTGP